MSVGHPSESMLAVPEFEPTGIYICVNDYIYKKKKKVCVCVCVFAYQYHQLVHASTYATL
jgi:hypothetical protein